MISAGDRREVRRRADNRCEYCCLRQEALPFSTFHVEHIIPRQHGGADDLGNLALACHHCNEHKGPNLSGLDPRTGSLVSLYNPRTQRWEDHFRREGARIHPLTPTGRATVWVLAMNSTMMLQTREQIP